MEAAGVAANPTTHAIMVNALVQARLLLLLLLTLNPTLTLTLDSVPPYATPRSRRLPPRSGGCHTGGCHPLADAATHQPPRTVQAGDAAQAEKTLHRLLAQVSSVLFNPRPHPDPDPDPNPNPNPNPNPDPDPDH